MLEGVCSLCVECEEEEEDGLGVLLLVGSKEEEVCWLEGGLVWFGLVGDASALGGSPLNFKPQRTSSDIHGRELMERWRYKQVRRGFWTAVFSTCSLGTIASSRRPREKAGGDVAGKRKDPGRR